MNKLGASGLTALVLLSQSPMQAQVRTTIPKVQIQQAQRDVEFLRLYQEVSNLEAKLENEPPETENRHYIKSFIEDGKVVELGVEADPLNTSQKILEIKYEEIRKLASRYGIPFDKNEAGIFAHDKSLISNNLPAIPDILSRLR